jgi:hypothetical protein
MYNLFVMHFKALDEGGIDINAPRRGALQVPRERRLEDHGRNIR